MMEIRGLPVGAVSDKRSVHLKDCEPRAVSAIGGVLRCAKVSPEFIGKKNHLKYYE
jgi:hypothetical protein